MLMSANTVLSLLFQSVCLYFFLMPPLSPHWFQSLLQHWIYVMRADSVAFSDFRRKAFSLSPLSMMLPVGLY